MCSQAPGTADKQHSHGGLSWKSGEEQAGGRAGAERDDRWQQAAAAF